MACGEIARVTERFNNGSQFGQLSETPVLTERHCSDPGRRMRDLSQPETNPDLPKPNLSAFQPAANVARTISVWLDGQGTTVAKPWWGLRPQASAGFLLDLHRIPYSCPLIWF
jgi:hypothetical protein